MKHLPLLVLTLLGLSSAVAQIQIETTFIGNAGNAADTTTYGSVSYNYYIGTYEVTNAQYTAFLNAVAATDTHGLYNTSMAGSFGGINRSGSSGSYTYSTIAGRENNPVNFVSFWDAARFANWLTNRQPTGDQVDGVTEDGMYDLNGVTNPTNDTVLRLLSFASGQNGVAIASENEWYKAAYYDPSLNSGAGGYWLYPTGSNTAPLFGLPPGGSNSANYDDPDPGDAGDVDNVTAVGAYLGSASPYGTFDQAGNVFEWNDDIPLADRRGLRGGSFDFDDLLQSSSRISGIPANQGRDVGFRVSSLAPIPEPSTYAAIVGGLGLLVALMRRKGRV